LRKNDRPQNSRVIDVSTSDLTNEPAKNS